MSTTWRDRLLDEVGAALADAARYRALLAKDPNAVGAIASGPPADVPASGREALESMVSAMVDGDVARADLGRLSDMWSDAELALLETHQPDPHAIRSALRRAGYVRSLGAVRSQLVKRKKGTR
jgi:hypothetical protein